MLDINVVRKNPELVKENMRKKFQDHKLKLVDEVVALDAQYRQTKTKADDLRALRNSLSKQIGMLMGQGKKDEAEATKAKVNAMATELAELEASEEPLLDQIKQRMMQIPNLIDPTVPIGKDDSENVERYRVGEAAIKPFEPSP